MYRTLSFSIETPESTHKMILEGVKETERKFFLRSERPPGSEVALRNINCHHVIEIDSLTTGIRTKKFKNCKG